MEKNEENVENENKEKKDSGGSLLKKVFNKQSYNDDKVYKFNISILIGATILLCFGLVMFFCF